ncbi:MAG: ABC transporter permease, partial [Armatimonadota bacterium]
PDRARRERDRAMIRGLVYKEIRELWVPAAIYLGVLLVLKLGAVYGLDVSRIARQLVLVGLPILALIAGAYTFARERSHGTEMFLHSLPYSRRTVWLVKMLTNLGVFAVVYGLAIALGGLATFSWQEWAKQPTVIWWWQEGWETVLKWNIATSIALWCAGAFFSSIRWSPMGAAWTGGFGFALAAFAWLSAIDAFGLYQAYLGDLSINMPPSTTVILAATLGTAAITASYLAFIDTCPLEGTQRTVRTCVLGILLLIAGGALFIGGVYWLGEPEICPVHSIYAARLSPDGEKMVLFTSRPYSVGQLWVANADGTGIRNIMRTNSEGPLWLGGSGHLLFDYSFGGEWFSRYRDVAGMADVKTGDIVWLGEYEWFDGPSRRSPIPCSPLHRPELISPSGRYAVLGYNKESGGLGERRVVQLLPELKATAMAWDRETYVLRWSSDESAIFVSEDGAQVMRVPFPEGGAGRTIATAPDVPKKHIRCLGISPHGRWVAWVVAEDAWDEWERRTYLKDTRTGRTVTMAGQPMKNGWSPDGRFLWFCGNDETPQGHPVVTVRLVDLSTGRVFTPELMGLVEKWGLYLQQPHTYMGHIRWSRDGSRAVFQDTLYVPGAKPEYITESGPAVLIVADADGSNPVALRDAGYPGLGFAEYFDIGGWSPDGEIIGVVDHAQVISLDPDTGERRVLLSVPDTEVPGP